MLSLNSETNGESYSIAARTKRDSNPSGILPTEFRVLVKPDPAEEKTKGGIIIPDETKERQQFATQKATLIAVSPAAFSYDEDIRNNAPKPGDRVLVAKYSGFEVEGADGVKYRVIADKDIAAILV